MNQQESERERLARVYFEKSDQELAEILADKGLLTDAAKLALAEECARRGIDFGDAEPPTSDAGNLPEYSGPLVVVKRFRDLPEAFVAKSILDSAGLDSFLADENLVRIDWLYSNLIGGAKLMVRPEDLAEADELLDEQANKNLSADEEVDTSSNETGAQTE